MKLRTPLLAILAVAVLASGGLVGKIYLDQDAQIFPRTVNKIPAPNPKLSKFENLAVHTPDGETLNGILFPAKVQSPTLLIAFGGNAHDVVGFASFLKNDVFPIPQIATAGVSYRGYPNVLGVPSTGTPTEVLVKADALTIYDDLIKRLHPSKIYIFGYSIGTGVATHVALNRPTNGLILIAPPASIRRLGEEKYPYLPVGALIKYPFATEDVISQVKVPTTLIYTPTDGLIPVQHIEILHNLLPTAQVISLEGTDHGNILFHKALPSHLQHLLGYSAIQPLQPSSTP